MPVNFLNKRKFNRVGRNNSGRIVVRYRKNYNSKKRVKLVDSKRILKSGLFVILRLYISYCNSSFLSLIYYLHYGVFSCILSSKNLKVGDLVFIKPPSKYVKKMNLLTVKKEN